MTVQIAMFLLAVCAAGTTLITEAVKKTITTKRPTIVALVVSILVGIGVPIAYLILNHLPIMSDDIVYIIGMTVLTWLCSTLGYDKVWEVINQFTKR